MNIQVEKLEKGMPGMGGAVQRWCTTSLEPIFLQLHDTSYGTSAEMGSRNSQEQQRRIKTTKDPKVPPWLSIRRLHTPHSVALDTKNSLLGDGSRCSQANFHVKSMIKSLLLGHFSNKLRLWHLFQSWTSKLHKSNLWIYRWWYISFPLHTLVLSFLFFPLYIFFMIIL